MNNYFNLIPQIVFNAAVNRVPPPYSLGRVLESHSLHARWNVFLLMLKNYKTSIKRLGKQVETVKRALHSIKRHNNFLQSKVEYYTEYYNNITGEQREIRKKPAVELEPEHEVFEHTHSRTLFFLLLPVGWNNFFKT